MRQNLGHPNKDAVLCHEKELARPKVENQRSKMYLLFETCPPQWGQSLYELVFEFSFSNNFAFISLLCLISAQ